MVNHISPEQQVQARQELKLLMRAVNALPPKCREVIWLRKVEQVSQRETAVRLSMSENAVEKHVMKGTRRLANALFGKNVLVGAHFIEQNEQVEDNVDYGAERGKQSSD